MDSGSDELIPSWLASKSKISEMSFSWKLILELMINLLAFIRSLREGKYPLYIYIYIYIHRYINSYSDTLLWTTTTMLNGSQFTSMMCWFFSKTRRNYISFSQMDISPSKKLIVSFHLWDQIKFFKGCLPQNLLSPLLNTLSQMIPCNFILNIRIYL